MEVSEAKFNLQKASDALTNARTQIHSFKVDVVEKALTDGEKVLFEPGDPDKGIPDKGVQVAADKALAAYTNRRIWLAISLVPILIVIGLLLLYIRTLPIPEKAAEEATGK